jgi:hypothetical protein
MKTLIAVPSYNRPYDIDKKTLYWLKDMKYDWKVFIYQSQARYYSDSVGIDNLIPCNDGIHLCGKIAHIYEYAKYHKYDAVFKVDDDMRFSSDGVDKKDAAKVCSKFLEEANELFKNPDVGLINVSKYGSYKWSDKQGFKKRKKEIASNYYIRTELLKNIHSKLILFDDLWVSLETKLAGKDIYQYFGAFEDAATHKNKGGLQSYDREKISRQSYEYAKTIYPKIEILENPKHNLFDISVKKYF